MIKTRLTQALLAVALALPGAALAAGGESQVEDVSFSFEGPFGTFDEHQLQRGFQVFHKVCSTCHGLKFLSFRDLGRADGPNFPEEQIKAIAALYEVKDEEAEDGVRPGLPSDRFPPNYGAGAPDLTLMAKARAGFHGPSGLLVNQLIRGSGGPEYIHAILTGYTDETKEVAGVVLYENHAMPGGWISMPPPLGEDTAESYEIDYAVFGPDGSKMGEDGEAKEGEGHGEGAGGEEDHGGGYASSYHPPEPTVDQMARDVAAFLMWSAEPTMVERKSAGFRNLIMIIILAVLLYYTNKKLWAPIKRNDHADDA